MPIGNVVMFPNDVALPDKFQSSGGGGANVLTLVNDQMRKQAIAQTTPPASWVTKVVDAIAKDTWGNDGLEDAMAQLGIPFQQGFDTLESAKLKVAAELTRWKEGSDFPSGWKYESAGDVTMWGWRSPEGKISYGSIMTTPWGNTWSKNNGSVLIDQLLPKDPLLPQGTLTPQQSASLTIDATPWYKKPAVMIGGGVAALVAVFTLTRGSSSLSGLSRRKRRRRSRR